MNTNTVNIKVIVGSTRAERFSTKPAQWIFNEIAKTPGVTAELLDLKEFAIPFYDEPISASGRKGASPHPEIERFRAKIAEADGFIVVTPEYNHGYSAVLKNALDVVYFEWNRKPMAFVAYGSVGGARAVEQLRQVAVELQMAPTRHAVHIPEFWTRTDEKGNLKTDGLDTSKDKMIEDLLWWTRALKVARTA